MTMHSGGCHCGRVRFEVEGAPEKISDCNCSICSKSAYLHWRIEPEQLRLLTPWEDLTNYQWGTGRASHYFCKHCGVAVLRHPRGAPDKFSVNARCIDGFQIAAVRIEHIDGKSLPLEIE
ncbi:MAG TPA: GFA family protein [Candidatus Binataceae bacterium]|nr:GFA family protein [Candidatus Binataceae bacterium]